MNKYNAKIDVIQSDNVYNKGKSITEKSEILHLKEIVKGTYKKQLLHTRYHTPYYHTGTNTTPHITTLVPYSCKIGV